MNEEDEKAPSLLDVARSVLWAMIGVQKSKNHERDFKTWKTLAIYYCRTNWRRNFYYHSYQCSKVCFIDGGCLTGSDF